MGTTLLLALALSATQAQAGEVNLYDVTNFPGQGELAGMDGWENGYSGDPWWRDGGVAASITDHNIGDTPWGTTYGSGGAIDNWIVKAGQIAQGGVEATFVNEDDDTVALVLGVNDGMDLYMAGYTKDNAPDPLGGQSQGTLFLIRVASGNATVVDTFTLDLPVDTPHTLRVDSNDGEVSVSMNGTLRISATDPAPIPAGRGGMYGYDSGEAGGGGGTTWGGGGGGGSAMYITAVRGFQFDDDDDDIVDDEDNCEFIANTDQADADNNGIGDACEGTTGTGTGGTGTGTATGTSTGTGTGGTSTGTVPGTNMPSTTNDGEDAFADETLQLQPGCTCNQGATPMQLWWLALPGLALIRRRR